MILRERKVDLDALRHALDRANHQRFVEIERRKEAGRHLRELRQSRKPLPPRHVPDGLSNDDRQSWVYSSILDERRERKISEQRQKLFRRQKDNSIMATVVPFPVPPKPAAPEPVKPSNLIRTSGEFVRDLVPPDYVVDRIFQRRFCYSITAKTGSGKTAVAMRIAAHVATGQRLGNIDVEKGTVIYFAGENPTDVQMRWLVTTQEMGIDPDTVDVHFINGVVPLSQTAEAISAEISAKGLQPALIVVDTVAAYFEGDDDNSNVQMGDYARRLRSMTALPGGPCVLVLAHPTKRAADDDLTPRGGGAFLNEVDGNVAVRRDGQLVAFEALGKFRGPTFEAVYLELTVVNHPKLHDSKGRPIPSVTARPVSSDGIAQREKAAEADETVLLAAIAENARKSRRDLAKAIGWTDSKVGRFAKKMTEQKLIRAEHHGWTITTLGAGVLADAERANQRPNHGPLPLPPLPQR